MRLRKLLIGSAAGMLAAGSLSVPATAADTMDDMNGLMVTAAQYAMGCADGAGLMLAITCITMDGEVEFEIKHGTEIDYGATPGANTTTTHPSTLDVDIDLDLIFTWEGGGKEVEITVPIFDPEDVEVDITYAGGWSFHFERYGLPGNSVIFGIPLWGWELTIGFDFDGGDFDVDVELEGEVGPVEVEFAVHSDELQDPYFDLTLGFALGNWDLTVRAATNGWGAGLWEPEGDFLLEGDVGPLGLALLFGWHDYAGDLAWALGAEADIAFGIMTLTGGILYAVGQADWDNFADDYGVFPYSVTAAGGERIWAFWGGVEAEWNDRHTTEFTVFFSESPDIAASQNLRLDVAHTWTPVGGYVEIEAFAWGETDFGGAVAGWVGGFGATMTIPLFPE